MSPEPPYPDLAATILSYLEEHPGAEDTVAGIAEWWILRSSLSHRVAEVRAALAELEEGGLIERLPGDEERYRLRTGPDSTPPGEGGPE